MIELTFEDDPAPSQSSPENRASWGGLKIWANGYNLCTHYEVGDFRESVNWNWWPLVQWLVGEWDSLFHEQHLPIRNAAEWGAEGIGKINHPGTFDRMGGWDEKAELAADDWFRHHCLWTCREGGLIPNIVFRRFLDEIEISWTQDVPSGAPEYFRFQFANGGVRLPLNQVAGPLFLFLTHASEYIEAIAQTKAASSMVAKVQSLKNKSKVSRRLGLLAGYPSNTAAIAIARFWDNLTKKLSKEFVEEARLWFQAPISEELYVPGNCQGALMFGAVAPVLSESDRLRLAIKLITHSIKAGTNDGIAELKDEIPNFEPSENSRPWEQGYELAEIWSSHVEIQSGNSVDISGYLQSAGIEVFEIDLSDPGISGVAVAPARRSPFILINESFPKHQSPNARRFTMAHELCHLIVDREIGANLAMASGPWAPKSIEKRANAFAAALLMPHSLIDHVYQKLDSKPWYGELKDLIQAAEMMEVGAVALCQHLCNRGYIDELKRDDLLSKLGPTLESGESFLE